MRSWTIRFKEPTTKEQHGIVIAGLSHYSYSIQERLENGVKKSRNKLVELGAKVVNLDMANQIMTNMEVVAQNIDMYFNWETLDSKTYKVQLAIDTFNKLFNVGPMPPKVGNKIADGLDKLINAEILPKMGLKSTDVEIAKEDSP